MTKLTYRSLLESRNNYNSRNGKCTGFEWTASKMPKTPLVQMSQGVPETVSKVIALALTLELNVGEWIADATKKELPVTEDAYKLLLSNIGDETLHYRAFQYAAEDYLLEDYKDTQAIFAEWNTDDYHPIMKAAYAEMGVFLVSLSILRLFGGESLSMLAGNVSRDEMRHVATNRGVLANIGHDFKQVGAIDKLVEKTLDWMMSDLKVPGLDKDFFMTQSKLLISDGYAPELEELTNVADDYSFFESPNALLY
jgi:hypothetical protein